MATLELWADRETCRDEHPVEWNASLILSLYPSDERGPAINSVVNRFHALLPFTEALSSLQGLRLLFLLGFFAKTNLLLCDSTCISLLLFISTYLSLSLVYLHKQECLSSEFVEWDFQSGSLGQLVFRNLSCHTWTYI